MRLLTNLSLGLALTFFAACGGSPADMGPVDQGGGTPMDDGPQIDLGPDAGDDGRQCIRPNNANSAGTNEITGPDGTATVTVNNAGSCERSYSLTTDALLRDGEPDLPVVVTEQLDDPILRTGHDMFDALYAVTLAEAAGNETTMVSDPEIAEGADVDCGGCYRMSSGDGFVRAREAGWAIWLGLAPIDPARARATLEFLLSERRAGAGDLQVVQDDGTGGGYPFASDRAVWAMAAWEVLNHLPDAQRTPFRDRVLEALVNTLQRDREVVFDEFTGLYRGENAFWNQLTQTYPEYAEENPAPVNQSWALSTNLLHLGALRVGARIAGEAGSTAFETQFNDWAADLSRAIADQFFVVEEGLFSSYLSNTLDPTPVERWDLLGEAMAVMFDVGSAGQRSGVLSRYPHIGRSAPVTFPVQQEAPIWMNRGEWPFATATWLRAAAVGNNDAVAARSMLGLVQATATNASHLQSYEMFSGTPFVTEGARSGPPVNPNFYLPSIGGYLSMVHHTLFGIRTQADGLVISPYVPVSIRNDLFGGTDQLVLNDYPYRGGRIDIVVNLPATGGTGGAYAVDSVTVNGSAVSGTIPAAMLSDDARVEVTLGAAGSAGTLTEITDQANGEAFFAPLTPVIERLDLSNSPAGIRLTIDLDAAQPRTDVFFRVWRDGQVADGDVPGTTEEYVDQDIDSPAELDGSYCYVVEACFVSTGLCGLRSEPNCWFGGESDRLITNVPFSSFDDRNGAAIDPGEPFGNPNDFAIAQFFPDGANGPFALDFEYRNPNGTFGSGITAVTLRVTVRVGGNEILQDYVTLSHLRTPSAVGRSSAIFPTLTAGTQAVVEIEAVEEAYNSSGLTFYQEYAGATEGPVQTVVISSMNVRNLPR